MNRNTMVALVLTAVCGGQVFAEDWPQWRGQNRDGVWNETGLVEKFESDKLERVWTAEVGAGYSGPTVAEGRVYVTDRITEPTETERVHCFDRDTGEPIWTHSYPCIYEIDFDLGPRASVTIDEGRAYSLGSMGHFHCYDAATGKVLWSKDLNSEYKIRMPIWGISASPLVYEDSVIVQIGGEGEACLVAFDKAGGEEKWRALEDPASYSSPILIEQAGHTVLVCWTGRNIVGLNPEDGSVHWTHPFKPTKMILNVATPVLHRDLLFLTAFYDGSMLLRLSQDDLSVEKIWKRKGKNEKKTDSLQSIIGTPYLKGEHIYGADSHGEFRCLDLMTGDRVWEDLTVTNQTRWGTVHMVETEDRMFMFNENGEVLIAKLSPDGFEEIDRAKLLDVTSARNYQPGEVCWSHPAFANQHIFARNDSELVCASLAAE